MMARYWRKRLLIADNAWTGGGMMTWQIVLDVAPWGMRRHERTPIRKYTCPSVPESETMKATGARDVNGWHNISGSFSGRVDDQPPCAIVRKEWIPEVDGMRFVCCCLNNIWKGWSGCWRRGWNHRFCRRDSVWCYIFLKNDDASDIQRSANVSETTSQEIQAVGEGGGGHDRISKHVRTPLYRPRGVFYLVLK